MNFSASLGFVTNMARRVERVSKTVGVPDCESGCYPVFFVALENVVQGKRSWFVGCDGGGRHSVMSSRSGFC